MKTNGLLPLLSPPIVFSFKSGTYHFYLAGYVGFVFCFVFVFIFVIFRGCLQTSKLYACKIIPIKAHKLPQTNRASLLLKMHVQIALTNTISIFLLKIVIILLFSSFLKLKSGMQNVIFSSTNPDITTLVPPLLLPGLQSCFCSLCFSQLLSIIIFILSGYKCD